MSDEPTPEAPENQTRSRSALLTFEVLFFAVPTLALMIVCAVYLAAVVPLWAAILLGIIAGVVVSLFGNIAAGGGNTMFEAGCGSIVGLFLVLALVPTFVQARRKGYQRTCATNLNKIARAAALYASDHDGRLPAAATWSDTIERYLPRDKSSDNGALLRCPAARLAFGYAWYDPAGGRELSPLPGDTMPLAFDSTDGHRNAHDAGSSLPRPGRHQFKQSGNEVVYVDGHARWVKDGEPLRPSAETRLLKKIRP
jgi:hypothetical protein